MKMDRRKKRTSTQQYMMYIEMMEKDPIFATGRVPRDVDVNYLQKRWKTLSDKLNTCSSGPNLTAEEWRKRLNDWKNTTRCKYRRSIGSDDVTLTSLEMKALELFGKAPNVNSSEQLSIHLKSEKDDDDNEDEMDQRASESFQKELQAAVEEAIGGDDDEEGLDDADDSEEVLSDPLPSTQHNAAGISGGGGGGGGGSGTTYRTIVVENAQYTDNEENVEEVEYVTTHRRQPTATNVPSGTSSVSATGVQTVVTTSAPATTVTKLINGDIPLKRMRSHASDQIIYEVKKLKETQHHPPHQHQPQRNITIHNTGVQQQQQHLHQTESNSIHHSHSYTTPASSGGGATASLLTSSADAREIARQLKRLADIKAEKLKFEVARFKFNNPGFVYNSHLL